MYGCGSSINDLPFLALAQFDSCGFNWFCFSNIPVTYYLVREQANIPKRVSGNETPENFINIIRDCYHNSCLIIHDISYHSPNALNYGSIINSDKFFCNYVIVKDIKLKNNNSGVKIWGKTDIVDDGIIHGKCTMNNVLHFVVQMGYKRVIFVGVDLYDSKYFWIEEGETRYSVKSKNKNYKSKHAIAAPTLDLVRSMKKYYPDIELYTYNPKSLLKDIIPIWEK